MVRVRDYTNKDGEEQHEIKLAGMGEEEEVKLTLKVDEVYEREIAAGVSKSTGKSYSSFMTYGVGAIYHKGSEEIDTWVKLTKLSAKELKKLSFVAGDIVIAYKKPGKKGDYVTFKKDGETTPVNVHSEIKTETIEAKPLASNVIFAAATDFEKESVVKALAQDVKLADIKFHLEESKKAGSDVGDTSIERVSWLISVCG